MNYKILKCSGSFFAQTLLLCSTSVNTEMKSLIHSATIGYILSAERFEEVFLTKKRCFSNEIV